MELKEFEALQIQLGDLVSIEKYKTGRNAYELGASRSYVFGTVIDINEISITLAGSYRILVGLGDHVQHLVQDGIETKTFLTQIDFIDCIRRSDDV